MIDIEELRLTKEELEAFDLRAEGDEFYGVSGKQLRPVAQAAVVKALWHLVEQFYNGEDQALTHPAMKLWEMLSAANIPAPNSLQYRCDDDICAGPALIDTCTKCGSHIVSDIRNFQDT